MINFRSNSSSFKVAITLFSQIWVAVIGIVAMPIYIKFLGVESYGLVAFYTSLTASLAILDLGLSTSVSRQLSIMRAGGTSIQDQRVLLFSIERVYWGIALLLGVLIISLSYPIAAYWVNSKELAVSVIQNTVILMGIAFVFQWPNSIYTGSLTGLQQQPKSAVITFVYATLRVIVILLALKLISPSVECFFIAQIIVTIFQSIMYRAVTWKQLYLFGHRPKFSKEQLRGIRKFAAGITGISLVSFALTQIDKLVVSKLVLLEFVGYYNLAFVLANIMITVITPMQTVFFPKFTALAATDQKDQLVKLFYKTARWISIIVVPIGCLFFFFSNEILLLWTKNLTLTENTAPILKFAALGTVCNALTWVPYFYLLAKGITKFTIYQNIIASVILTPLLFWLTAKYGAIGASSVWFIVNLGYVLISLPIFHYLYFKGHLLNWYVNNLLRPLLITVPLFWLSKLLLDKIQFHYSYFGFGLVLALIALIYCSVTKEIREFLLDIYRRKNKTG